MATAARVSVFTGSHALWLALSLMGGEGKRRMDEARMQMVVDYYKATDTPLCFGSMPCPTTRPKPTKPSATADGASCCHASAVCTKAALFSASAARRARTCPRTVRDRGAPLDWRTAVVALVAAELPEAIRAIPAGGHAGDGALSGHDRVFGQRMFGGSPRHAFMAIRYKHGAPSSWWCEFRVGGVGMRESVGVCGVCDPRSKKIRTASHVSVLLPPWLP